MDMFLRGRLRVRTSVGSSGRSNAARRGFAGSAERDARVHRTDCVRIHRDQWFVQFVNLEIESLSGGNGRGGRGGELEV